MSLSSQVQARISGQLLIELTNHGSTAATTLNTTRLDAACDDATAELLIETGITYDDTDKVHVALMIDGVLYYLHMRTGQTGRNLDSLRDRWHGGLVKLAQTRGGERRILPTTTSVLETSSETSNARPDHDRSRWADFVPRVPAGDDYDDEC